MRALSLFGTRKKSTHRPAHCLLPVGTSLSLSHQGGDMVGQEHTLGVTYTDYCHLLMPAMVGLLLIWWHGSACRFVLGQAGCCCCLQGQNALCITGILHSTSSISTKTLLGKTHTANFLSCWLQQQWRRSFFSSHHLTATFALLQCHLEGSLSLSQPS